jgi:hypothetical protein
MDHLDSYLEADGVVLSDDVLDRIDRVVAPGVTVSAEDGAMWNSPDLEPAARRR